MASEVGRCLLEPAAFRPPDAIRLDGVTALRRLAADLLEMQVHRLRVGKTKAAPISL